MSHTIATITAAVESAEAEIRTSHGMGGHTAAMMAASAAVKHAERAARLADEVGHEHADELAPWVARAETARAAGQAEVDWYYGDTRP